MVPDKPKLVSETPGMGQMASFRMDFKHITQKSFLEKVYRKTDNLCGQAVLNNSLINLKKCICTVVDGVMETQGSNCES